MTLHQQHDSYGKAWLLDTLPKGEAITGRGQAEKVRRREYAPAARVRRAA